ncbi:uncharacterized protein KQ657_000632 [Scheffersomyces spartinae]|uniref:Uncharacterized protein n=1 Tax=Scheffersomyces spartinae TaxID=45513 RepID=A0A9P7V935_9ASCO|nr:uncharacterized protein KQ657_000632 [Scheffersomyces spartinae]KAG7193563.1 hypothetical protein KQ657_000632 [Scheffersomyces spartinae]
MSGKIDSLDAKIVQYQYAIIQLQIYIPQIKEFQKSLLLKPNQVPLMQYIVVAIQQLFLISEGPFNARLKLLLDYGLFKPLSVTVPATVSHVPYDIQDLAVVPLSSVPSSTQAFKCLKLLELLCQNCLHAYLARLHQAKLAKLEQSRMTDDPQLKLETIDQQMDELATFLKEKLFNDNSMLDLNDLMFELPPDHETLNSDATYVEATLIDFDMKMLYYISKVKSIVEDTLNVELTRLRNIRSFSSPTAQINYLSQLPHAHLTMHLILALTLRLNEIYNITRRFGRQIYFPNAQHLYDSKLISQTKNPTYFKLHVLKDFDELANANKKNGTLIATITRFIRANSEFEVNAKNVLNITNILNLAHSMIVTSLTSIEEFRNYWIYAEVKFRKAHSIPRKNLAIIHQQFNPAPPPPSQPSQPPSQPQPQPPKVSSSISPTLSRPQTDDSSITTKESLDSATQLPTIMTNLTQPYNSESSLVDLQETGAHRSPTTAESINASSALIAKLFNDDHIQSIESDFKTLDIKNQVKLNTPSGNRSRSSSQSSVNSNGSLSRRSIYGTLNSPSSSKRSSLYAQKNGSLTNFPTTEYSSSSSSQAPPTVGNRRRANSQPIRPTSMYVTSSPPIMQPKSHAASGAAAALVRNMNKQDVNAPATNTAIVRSSNGMVRRSPSLTKKAQAGTQGANQVSPLAHKIQPFKKPARPSVVEEEGEQVKPAVQRMTANQRLQQHLKNASQQGSLVTQQKEQLKSVTVDVSELSQLNMKRYTEQPPLPPPPPPPPLQQQQQASVSPKNGASVAEVSPGKITRLQMTKINTHKNSMNMHGEEGGPLSSSSTSSTPSTISYIGDKVRSRSILVLEDGSSVVKRVRFIGVPQYSEAEDAPSNYAQKILRNFAMLRPGKPSQQRLSFAQKEHLLKKEESISFRKQLHSNVPS